jgi:hypothetical protein
MPAVARKLEPEPKPELNAGRLPEPEPSSKRRRKVFYASVLVTRVEEWFVEADCAEEARALFAAGEGHRSTSGERIHLEVERLLEGGD